MTISDLIHPVWIAKYNLAGRQGQIITLPARELLTHKRFDLFAKLWYIRHRKDRPALAKRVYCESLRSIVPHGKEWGKEKEKNSFSTHIKVFDKLIDSFSQSGFDPSVSLVPVGEDNILIDGAHRTAALSYFGKEVTICKFDSVKGDLYGYAYFRERDISALVESIIAREMIDWLPGLKIILVRPEAYNESPDLTHIAYFREIKTDAKSRVRFYIVTKDCHLPQAPGRRVIEDAESVKSLADQLLLPRWFDSPMAPLRRAPQRIIGDIRFYFHRFIRDWNDRQYKLKCRLLESDSKTVAFLHKLYNYLRHYGKQNM